MFESDFNVNLFPTYITKIKLEVRFDCKFNGGPGMIIAKVPAGELQAESNLIGACLDACVKIGYRVPRPATLCVRDDKNAKWEARDLTAEDHKKLVLTICPGKNACPTSRRVAKCFLIDSSFS